MPRQQSKSHDGAGEVQAHYKTRADTARAALARVQTALAELHDAIDEAHEDTAGQTVYEDELNHIVMELDGLSTESVKLLPNPRIISVPMGQPFSLLWLGQLRRHLRRLAMEVVWHAAATARQKRPADTFEVAVHDLRQFSIASNERRHLDKTG